jgi:hypothetical protein
VTAPGDTTPGPDVPESGMTVLTGTQTLTDGQIIENTIIRGRVVVGDSVTATLRNVVVEMPAVTTGVPLSAVSAWGAGATLTIEDFEVRVPVANRSYRTSVGLHGSNITARRGYLTGFVDGVLGAGIEQRGDLLLEDVVIRDVQHYADDGGIHSDGTHDDSIQLQGNLGDVVVRRCTIPAAYSAAFMVTQDIAGGYDSLTIEDNTFPVDITTYGALLNFKLEDATIPNVTVRRNLFSTKAATSKARIVMDAEQLAAAAITATGPDANGWLPDGTPPNTAVPVYRGSGVSPSNLYTY